MAKKRIGLIGVGGVMHYAHIPGYRFCDDAEITAICDISDKALEKTRQKLGLGAENCYKDYRELIDSGKCDAVDIATPNSLHVEIAMYALEKGLPCSVEKPIGVNFDRALRLAAKSRETGLPVFVCFSWRYRDFPRCMKRMIDAGEVGDLYHIYITCVKNSRLWAGRRLEWRFQEEMSGSGVLCDLGSHMFDMIRFFGYEIDDVYCDRGICVKRRQVEDGDEWKDVTTDDWSNVVLHLKSGIGATVTLSAIATTEPDRIEFKVYGSKGSLHYVYLAGDQHLYKCVGEDVRTGKMTEVEVPRESTDGWGGQSRTFVDLLNGKKDRYAATIEEGLRTQVVIDAAVRSSQLRRAVTVKEMFDLGGRQGE